MKCIKCNVQLPKKSKYCIRCGTLLDDTYRTKKNTKEDILLEYIINGKSYNSKVSIKYLCLNFTYAFYKKMYKEGIISFCALLFLTFITVNYLNLLIAFLGFSFLPIIFISMICVYIQLNYVFNFDNMYLEDVYNFVQKTIKSNDGVSLEKLESICDKRRQNDLFSAVVSVVVFLCFLIL